jgi:rod shape-determining protein MreD
MMMMDRDNILLPVSPTFIAVSLIGASFLNILPWGAWGWVPDFVALTLVFWSIYQPRKASLLGENALAYTLLSYFAITIHRRVLWFKPTTQALHVLPLLVVMQIIQILIQLAVSSKEPGWSYFLQSLVAALIWPVVCWVLLAPQRRAIDHDETRPI